MYVIQITLMSQIFHQSLVKLVSLPRQGMIIFILQGSEQKRKVLCKVFLGSCSIIWNLKKVWS